MAEAGTITDEGVARLRARIGVPEPNPQPPHYRCPGTDAFRHVAEAYGDDNPLWCEPDYGATTRWGGVIAPPPLVGGDTLIGVDEVTDVAPEHRDLLRGDPLRGVHAYYSASAREWWAPLRPGRAVRRRNALVGVLDKPSEFAGRAVHEWTAQVFRDPEVLVRRAAAAHGPHRTGQRRVTGKGRGHAPRRGRTPTTSWPPSTPSTSGSVPGAASLGGGRTSRKATSSARS